MNEEENNELDVNAQSLCAAEPAATVNSEPVLLVTVTYVRDHAPYECVDDIIRNHLAAIEWLLELHGQDILGIDAHYWDDERRTFQFWTPEEGFSVLEHAPAPFRAALLWWHRRGTLGPVRV